MSITYGEVGTSYQQVGGKKPVGDWLIMDKQKPSRDHTVEKVDDDNGIWVISKETLRQKLQMKRDIDMQLMTVTRTTKDESDVITETRVYQTRPQDMMNFQVGIAQGQTKWVMADNTIKNTTPEELTSVYNEALDDAKVIWDTYIEDLEAINNG